MYVHPKTQDPRDGVEDLERLRAQLDGLDRDLLDTLRARIRCCVHIAEVKRRHGVAMMQPHRVAAVHERASSYAAANGLDAAFLKRLYDVIIEETCRVEDLVIASRDE